MKHFVMNAITDFLADAHANFAADALEVVAIAGSLVIGFHLVSYLPYLIHQDKGLGGKKVVCSTEEQDTEALSEHAAPKNAYSTLMEQYGVFGAPAGTWSQSTGMQEEELDDLHSEGEEDQEEEGHHEPEVAPRAAAWHSLMEQYGVFGASAGAWCEEEEEQDADLPEAPRGPSDWKALLEHHGVFGAPAGSWTQARSAEEDEETEEHEAAEEEDDWEEDETVELEVLPRAPSDWKALLEHHGVFGAPAGSWCQTTNDEGVCGRDEDVEEEWGLEEDQEDVAQALSSPRPPAWASLMEQYGAFGAPAGSWCRHGCAEEVATDTEDESETMALPLEEDSIRPCWKSLLEHHGVFGAPAGAWCGPRRGEEDEWSTAEEAESEEEEVYEVDEASEIVSNFPRSPAPCWKALLEQYSLFDTAA